MDRWYGLTFDPDQHVTVTCGVTEAILATLMGIINTGDEVIVIEPYHEGYLPAIVFAGGVPRFVPLEAPAYTLDLDMLRDAMNDRTRDPHQHSPHHLLDTSTPGMNRKVSRICAGNVNVVAVPTRTTNITYKTYSPHPQRNYPGIEDRTVTISDLGEKTFAMTGWRLV
jgi:aminotransferase